MNARKAIAICVCVLSLLTVTCQKKTEEAKPEAVGAGAPSGITITLPPKGTAPTFPADIPGGAPNASLTQAAQFAWQEFIAATWPAQPNGNTFNRDTADANAIYGANASTANGAPLVWETYRHKVEIFPGTTSPGNYQNNAPPHGATQGAPSFGYNEPPQYNYAPNVVSGACAGTTPAASTPWVNADENSQIFLDTMYAGILGTTAPQQIFFLAKANSVHYQYTVNPQNFNVSELYQSLWNHSFATSTNPPNSDNPTYNAAVTNFITYQAAVNGGTSPTPPLTAPYVSFPSGTIEVKSAWRPLTTTEASSGRFHLATVRHYEQPVTGQQGTCSATYPCCTVDEPFGLLALHIIHKTPTAPYFVYATFSQADNIVDANGNPIEDAEGRMLNQNPGPPLDTGLSGAGQNPVTATLATPTTNETYNVMQTQCQPGSRLYLTNTTGVPTPQGPTCVNQREHPIPQEIIDVNQAAHDAITAYNQQYNGGNTTPWNFYKLVNVQAKPINKQPGVLYTGADAATFYQSNEVVETNYNLQFFSGRLVSAAPSYGNLMSDYVQGPPNTNPALNQPFNNTFYLLQPDGSQVQTYNMGGCMGCHGNAQQAGDNFSFIMNVGRNDAPEPEIPNGATASAQAKVKKFTLPSS